MGRKMGTMEILNPEDPTIPHEVHLPNVQRRSTIDTDMTNTSGSLVPNCQILETLLSLCIYYPLRCVLDPLCNRKAEAGKSAHVEMFVCSLTPYRSSAIPARLLRVFRVSKI